ncbi:MAG: hypothetical protein ACHQYQ_11945 [Bacteriovoracales bacterium]
MLEQEIDLSFQSSQKLYCSGQFRKTLEKLTLCNQKLKKDWYQLVESSPS